MEIKDIITELEANAKVFHTLLADIPPSLYRWKPDAEKWSLLEIICHLFDEERDDFRARTRHTLETPAEPMPPFNPIALVTERKYMEQDFTTQLKEFLLERKQSIAWLRSLENANWENTYQHPTLGPLSAQMFLYNWLVHDYIHIRQILKVKYAHLEQSSGFDLSYAGNW